MKMTRLVLVGVAMAGLAACDGGGIDLNVDTTDNSCQGDGACQTNNTGGGGNNPCASYTVPNSNEVRQGAFDGANCVYDSNFVGESNPLLTDLTIPFISGKHIFQDSLFVGQNVDSGAAPAGGTGPTLTIAPGNTLVWQDAGDYLLVNRGSQIIANGTPSSPITLTSFTDAIQNAAGANDVQQWGGLVINGNGITNNCTDDERANNQCHVTAEGKPSNYGGNDNAESSGSLRYVVVKHSGFAVVEGDELNGITINAVGSGTVVENVQMALISNARQTWNLWSRASALHVNRANDLLELVGMADQAERAAAILAYGDLKRLELAIALAHDPKLLLMDEPTAGMAPKERVRLMQLTAGIVRDQGISVLFTEHDMDVVFAHAHRIMVLNRGELIAVGSVDDIRNDARVQEVYLGGGRLFEEKGKAHG